MAGGSPPQSGREGMNASFVNTSLLGVAISLPLIATGATILRWYARRLKNRATTLHADDWMLLITLILCWAHSINTIVAGGIGGINTIKIPPREYATVALRTLWISTLFLVSALYTIKVSILVFYYQLFSVATWFRRAVIGMLVILTLWFVSSIMLALLSTVPFDGAFKDAATAKHRFDFNAWYISYSGLSILFDVIILCFPIPMIKSLKVTTKEKISILGIFWLGGFVCVSAIIRFVFLYNSIYRLTDFGQNQYSSITVAFIWAEVEPNTSVIAACLPTYRPLFKNGVLLPRMVSSMRSALGLPAKQATGSDVTGSNPSEYYQLDKPKRTKKNDALVKEMMNSGTRTTASDIEAHEMIDTSQLGRKWGY
ncbi:uncharacterized protein EI97DRAFT_461205 [Westerdykella ornata]|uniref:Rhodopsin domain-containing protein n=1 Tax=Westerdykella ornata TaxID=318751 RepID=A0A6A6JAW9_WESOR|nr:uncharacterized protein EI97DRAFT_461205 [Westerdykella ornata]KAF2273323.1 hypothetical protein EI97DRAFT_461205 [Westerdykella ornata]